MSDRRLSFDIVIVGAGPAGLAAACAAAESGKRVAVLDEAPWIGGQIWRGEKPGPSNPQAREWIERFRASGVDMLDRHSVIAAPGVGALLAEHPEGAREIHYEKLILATGARELFLPFPGWTTPGVFGPGGLQALAKNGWPVAGKRVVVAGTGPLLLAVADGLKKRGAKIVSIAEQAPLARVAAFGLKLMAHPGKILQGLGIGMRLGGIPYRCGVWPVMAEGHETIRSITLTDGRKTWVEECDLLACGFHLVPNTELPVAIGCELSAGFVRVDDLQVTTLPNVYCAGEPTGVGGADCALVEGRIAGYAASGAAGKAEALFSLRKSWHGFRAALSCAFALRGELKRLATDETLLCRCEDVPIGRVKQFTCSREAKLLARCGMGACQGRICGAATAFLFDWSAGTVRPPVLPSRVSSLLTTTNSTIN